MAIIEGLRNDPRADQDVAMNRIGGMIGDEQMSSQQEVGIFTDSLSNLQTIKKGVAETAEQEVLLRTLAQHQVKLTLPRVACFAQLQEWGGGTKFVPPIKNFFSDLHEIWTRNVF